MTDTIGVGTAAAVAHAQTPPTLAPAPDAPPADAPASDVGGPEAPAAAVRLPNGRFAPGHSGNPKGRTAGSRHHATLAQESLVEGEAEALAHKVIALALTGDTMALKMCLDRLVPPLRSRPLAFELPEVHTAADVSATLTTVLTAALNGEIDTEQAQALAVALEAKRKSLETIEIEERLQIVEKKLSRDQSGL